MQQLGQNKCDIAAKMRNHRAQQQPVQAVILREYGSADSRKGGGENTNAPVTQETNIL